MIKKTAVVLASYTLTDPTTRHTIYSIHDFFDRVIVVQQGSNIKYSPIGLANTEVREISDLTYLPVKFGIRSILKWLHYKRSVRSILREFKPDCIITFQLSTLAALKLKEEQKLISCIYDIPDPDHSGKLDTIINRQGFNQLKNASVVWASDNYKSKMAMQLGSLEKLPIVCYNCPTLAYANDQRADNKIWLRDELRKAGAQISNEGGTIMIRAGAIGPYGGIEETLKAMQKLSEDNLFLMMGRPGNSYSIKLKSLIKEYNLEKRAFFWDRPNDATWKKAMFGSDIGHLIHLKPPESTPEAGMFQHNSSLSNYRLFYYMAAGLPIFSYNDARMNDIHAEAHCFIVLKVEQLVKELIQNWRLLSEDSLLRESMGNSGRQLFKNTYNWETQFKEIRKFFENI